MYFTLYFEEETNHNILAINKFFDTLLGRTLMTNVHKITKSELYENKNNQNIKTVNDNGLLL